jgi:hypothetical protein
LRRLTVIVGSLPHSPPIEQPPIRDEHHNGLLGRCGVFTQTLKDRCEQKSAFGFSDLSQTPNVSLNHQSQPLEVPESRSLFESLD